MKIKVEIDGQTYQVEVEDIHVRPVVAIVEGERYEVWPESETPVSQVVSAAPVISVPEPAPNRTSPTEMTQAGSGKAVTAPLPGVIMAILVKAGEKVVRGQELCTLEAMKMKNAIKSSRDGVIEGIEVNIGDQVSHGQVLMTFSE
ncbi:MAG: biotin/lipoyl-containing protein [Chloroflexota bacterium]|nr:biotin/lipoyl-containing protein [Chloroflexota bacterium]